MSSTEFRVDFIIGAILFLILLLVYEGISYSDSVKLDKGCPCGGRYVYQQAVGHRYTTTYIYRCDKCGRVIEVKNYEG